MQRIDLGEAVDAHPGNALDNSLDGILCGGLEDLLYWAFNDMPGDSLYWLIDNELFWVIDGEDINDF